MTQYDLIIRPKRHAFDINFKEIWQYRDLLYMFVKRDVITVYKQTVLGPIWFIVQPILTTFIYIVVFGKIAQISTDGQPMALFYLSGIVIWNYFAESFNQTSDTFTQNAAIFGKVYFPRLIMPLSKVTSGLIKFFIQLVFFLAVYAYFLIKGEASVQPNWTIALLPVYITIMALMGMGAGILFTSMTTKYRDLKFLITFGVQLLMYSTPVIYPMSEIPEGKMKTILMLNPLSPIVEGFKYAFLGAGNFSWGYLGYSAAFTTVLLVIGIVVFHKTERNFIDTV
ncbi:ABC transporter permease [Alkalitalea saponilacus]|uniref:Transport permease protein n=1 Tax=Alkalitalea saponilacus TaxID=889453 RepID=A0A1T5H111_9BACT|nr:ABC transporter permease [Alkalitalea saponilacus]ASB50941.1 ABC transporter permease [Alkalitalea saponilacus]SKC14279.1 lipopolysaccharide transport system permease protein [Alkalitalea saponilacus]